MVTSISQVCREIQDFFGWAKKIHLSFGRRINPVYVINHCPKGMRHVRESGAIVQNTWYTLLEVDSQVRINCLSFRQETANEDLEIKITDDYGSVTVPQTAVAGTYYNVKYASSNVDRAYQASSDESKSRVVWDLRNCKIEYRKTSANGANNTEIHVVYQEF